MRGLLVYFFLFSFILFSGLGIYWFIRQYKREKRSLWLGVFFITALLGLMSLLGLLIIRVNNPLLTRVILILASLIFIVFILPFPIILVSTMIISGISLIRKEGGGIAHILSLGFGIAYALYLIIWPMMDSAFHLEYLNLYIFICHFLLLLPCLFLSFIPLPIL